MIKIFIWCFAVIAAVSLVVGGVLIFSKKPVEPRLQTEASVGVWWWTKEDADKYLDFAAKNGVDEIYYCDYALNEDTYAFVKKAKELGIKVFALFGEKEWVENKIGLDALIEKYRIYQAVHSDAKFEGVHLDIEPQQFDDFEQKTSVYLTKFVQMANAVVSENADISFDFDIPAWLDKNEQDYQVNLVGVVQTAYKHLIDIANRVFVMSYRDTAEAAVDFAENELEYADAAGKQIAVCFECGESSEGDKVSFFEEGKEALANEVKKLETLLSQDYMLAIHNIKSWFELKNQ